ncbi:MAG: chemotaxis protein CheW [bacterium]
MSQNEYGVDAELIVEFVDESLDNLNNATNSFITLEADPNNKQALNGIFRCFHTLKGNAAFFNLLKVKSLAHIMEELMKLINEGKIKFSRSVANILISGIDELKAILERVRTGKPEVIDEQRHVDLSNKITLFIDQEQKKDCYSIWKNIKEDIEQFKGKFVSEDPSLNELFQKISKGISTISPLTKDEQGEKIIESEDTKEKQVSDQSEISEKTLGESTKTMRIAEATIDKFLDYVGELVVINETYGHVYNSLLTEYGMTNAVMDLQKNNESFSDLSQSLQTSILEIRKITIKTLLQRAPRIVRDVALTKGKEIKVTIKGDELLIDKSLIETLEGPFIHLLRNAADHGIETTEVRREKGKKIEGEILIDVTENEDNMFINIQDDGAGIDKKVVLEKAISNKIITTEKAVQMTEQELYQLLFIPGFSTVKEVTDISGRGVGMDIVKKNTESIGGKILIQSTPNLGSKFTLMFPKSVAIKIIDGFLVLINKQRYILPMNLVSESFEVKNNNITDTPGGGKCIMRHGLVYPLLKLSSIMNLRTNNGGENNNVGVTITVDSKPYVFLVDEVLGIQQILIKDIKGLPCSSEFIQGGAILGNEEVALVLNIEKILKTC